MILDALAAFCEPGAGVQGVEICKNVWARWMRAELVNREQAAALRHGGVENELEGVETPAQRYPATIPFLRLLNTPHPYSQELAAPANVGGLRASGHHS